VNDDKLQLGCIVQGTVFPEPVRVVITQPVGPKLKVGGKGLRTKQYIERLLDQAQLATLSVNPPEASFDGDASRFRLGIEAARLALVYEYDPYFSMSVARVDPLPHQLEAVYHDILPLPRIRFLLADDAGAGKTIMAGLVLKELKARGLVQRTLIVTPANLCFQWQRELRDRFRERFDIIRGVDLRTAYGTNPWQDKPQVITSIDWAKRDDVKESLSRADWDVIIVDEAHRMSASDPEHKTERYQLGELLSHRTDHFLMLTATPHKGDPTNFCLFLQLLDKDVYGDVRSLEDAMRRNHAPFYLRRIKEALVSFPDPATGEVRKLFTKRDVRTARFMLDGAEFDFYDALTKYVQNQSIRAAADQSATGRALGFTMAMYQRRFASSIHAVRRSLERRLEKLEKRLRHPQPVAAFDEWRLEDLDELPDDEAAQLVEEVEDVSLPSERRRIQEEITELRPLLQKARELEAREISSKLKKLHEVLIEQKIFDDPKTKLLIFTEHKETLDYLVECLGKGTKERPGWGLKVTQIHGGMKIGDRDTPGTRLYAEREFREQAQVMVATEAAGEGINLQFCWLMINYDIPWNPMRLEQRMGRIHRYGQEHDCLIFNFVAGNTREGQVLERLLERLWEIRKELGIDQVFDVVGEVFSANLLERYFRDLYAGRTTFQTLLERVVKDADLERFHRITSSTLEGLAKRELNLSVILGRTAEAKERRLVPEVVQEFFLQAAPLAGFLPPKGKDGVFAVGRVPRGILSVGQRLESRFGPLGKEYRSITFDKKYLSDDPTLEWVTPGHPLFEAVREEIWERAREDLRNGAVFYDLNWTEPGRLEVYSASIADGRGRTLHQRLFVVEVSACGGCQIRQPTIFLDLAPAPAGSTVPESNIDQATIESFLLEHSLEPFLAEVKAERDKELETIARHVELSLNTLIDREQRKLAEYWERQQKGEELSGVIKQTEDRLDDLNARLERRREELQQERQLTLGDLTHVGSAWVLPHPERTSYAPMVQDEEIERIAMEEAMRYEEQKGWQPEDVSGQNRGFDILSRYPASGAVRFIEVKGRATAGTVALSRNEYKTAERLKQDYWLYVVFDCASSPRLLRVKDPARLGWEPIVRIDHYQVSPKAVESATEPEDAD